jgi:hypothetical protein
MSRPIAVTVIGILYIAMGAIGLVVHVPEVHSRGQFASDALWASLVSLVAAVCGLFMFRAQDWARWLAIAWIGFHVVLSFFHSAREVIVHGLLFALLAWFLFRPRSNDYFRSRRGASA